MSTAVRSDKPVTLTASVERVRKSEPVCDNRVSGLHMVEWVGAVVPSLQQQQSPIVSQQFCFYALVYYGHV